MKKFLGFFFTILYLTALLRPVMPLAEYMLNQEYIAEVLCINKSRPALQCNGKCYLKQQYKETKQESEKRQEVEIKLSDYPIGFITPSEVPQQFREKADFSIRKERSYAYTVWYDIFHPPQLT